MKQLSIFILATAAFASGWLAAPRYRAGAASVSIVRDTVVRHDTVRVHIPVPTEAKPSERIVTIHDTIHLPAERRVYEDTVFRAVVSGIEPRLDSLTFYRPVQTITLRSERQSSPWGIGVTAGAAVTSHGLTPSITFGITYTIKRW
ncbi:MAG: hypothetical protein NC039_05390 [Muribaculaceae bacterium]|nr:hypothetical protein [Muribaculaceae bacterium]